MSATNDMTVGSPDLQRDQPKSRVERKREERIERILRVASIVLAEHGYHNTSLEMIADRLDLTKASLYHYYDSKDSLFEACLERVALKSIQTLNEISRSEGSATERLRALIVGHLDILISSDRELARLYVQQLDWPESMLDSIRRWRSEHRAPFDRVIEEGISTGEFSPRDDLVARHCMFGAMNYLPVWFRSRGKDEDRRVIDSVAEELVAMFAG
ncbi:TetR/AcrR family transcriptional regulator [Aeromicrobium piscarium]|uniref:TetR/AcrR family transcriptional regulator n=1 Tax=Aeromicrobium piscarium TaxID=2590901 RepID=A0A554S7Q0_9ACTN|nr:TetR/AcrR family transcriptional regulator [Aeromicrobium piscarium]TSD62379.1 TetR/AcrR family transcriptional regulator [Aeromicrobium piscarium]